MMTLGLCLGILHTAFTAGRNLAAGLTGAGDNRLPYYRASRLIAAGVYAYATACLVAASAVVNHGW